MVVKGPVKYTPPKQPKKESTKKQPKVEKAVEKEPIKPIEEVVLQEEDEDEVSKILSELDKKD